jgi:anti-sigma-K factor RskA
MSPQHDDAMLDLVAAYAAGALPAGEDECAALREHLDECETCRRELRRYATAATAVGVSATQAAPPGLRERVLSKLAPRPPLHIRHRRPWQIPAAVAAAVALAAGAWWLHASAGPSWTLACTQAAPACQVRGTVKAFHGFLHVEMEGLPALPAGKQYQAWIILPGKRPTPEPAFSPDARGHGAVVMAASPVKGAVVAITIEKAGGSPVPTSKPILIAHME